MYIVIRIIDFIGALVGMIVLSPIILIIVVVGWFDTRSPLFFQKRVGYKQRGFILVKFRTMQKDTPSVASHLVQSNQITSLGSFLRKTKLDELPQLWNVLIGQMSLVGPRPCLPNQEELIREREMRHIFLVKPGITGLAQIRNIDMSDPVLLAKTEAEMLDTFTLQSYFLYILKTIAGKGRGDAVK
jgi:O-antigen biosynthesis protein WbqP